MPQPAFIARARSLLSPALGALLITAALIVVLVWQTLSALRVQRTAEVDILRNYAEIAADAWVRQSSSQIGYRAYYQTLNALSQVAVGSTDLACDATRAWAQSDDPVRAVAVSIIDQVVVLGDQQRLCGDPDSDAIEHHIRTLEADSQSANEQAMNAFHEFNGVHARSWIFTLSGSVWIAFSVNPNGLRGHFARLQQESDLLPRSLGPVEDQNARLQIEVRDPAATIIYQTTDTAIEARASFQREYGSDYGGVLSGYQIKVAVLPELATRLVQQSPPVLPLEYLFGLALMATLLGAVALYQLRSERALIKLRTDFVARVSHELRTPLTQISLYADTLVLGRTRSDADRQHALAVIQREARRLTHLIGNILRFSTSHSAAKGSAPSEVPLNQALIHAVEAARMLAPDREIKVMLVDTQSTNVAIDRDALHLALVNLLDNALKYSPADQPVVVSSRHNRTDTSIEIEDAGSGIPKELREHVLQAYFRLERDRQSATPGTGIGLSVVHSIVGRYGGKIGFGQSALGGTQATLNLPVAPTA